MNALIVVMIIMVIMVVMMLVAEAVANNCV